MKDSSLKSWKVLGNEIPSLPLIMPVHGELTNVWKAELVSTIFIYASSLRLKNIAHNKLKASEAKKNLNLILFKRIQQGVTSKDEAFTKILFSNSLVSFGG